MSPLDAIFASVISFLEELFALIFSFVTSLEGLDQGDDEE
jgi:hypothetical protein